MSSLAEQLKRCPLCSELSPEVIARDILPRGQIRAFLKGQYIIMPQQRVDQFGIVLSGRVHTMHIFPDGNYNLMSVLGPFKVLGADLVCTRSRTAPYHAVTALSSQVLYLPGDLLLQPGTLEESVRLSMLDQLLTLIAQENMKKEYRLAILSQKGLRERILTYLTMQVRKRGANTIKVSFSREEMASFLCVNRSALSHELSLMQREGIIRFRKNVFTLLELPEAELHLDH